MIKILVADDNEAKVKNIRIILDGFPEITDYDIATDLINTKKALSTTRYDLLLLDLHLPTRVGDMPESENGKNFINELNRSQRLIKPTHIVGLSAYSESISEFKKEFDDDDIWSLIMYEESSKAWSKKLQNKIEYLIQSKRDLSKDLSTGYEYDIAIVTALRTPELQSILDLPGDWLELSINNDSTKYYRGTWRRGDGLLHVVAAAAPQMGMVSANLLTLKMIANFKPKYVCMTGIAAGMQNEVNLGDILATDLSFDSGSGKIKSIDGSSQFQPDYKSISISTDMKEILLDCGASRDYLNDIKAKWRGNKPDTELNLKVGPLASGAGVIQDNKVVEQIKDHQRKLIGIDMETYGVFYAVSNCPLPRPITAMSFKSASDFADESKSDDFQTYAAFTSANFLYELALDKIINQP